VDALVWVLTHSEPPEESKGTSASTSQQQKAEQARNEAEQALAAALEQHSKEEVRGRAGFALALYYARRAEQTRQSNPRKSHDLAEKAEAQLENVNKKYAAIPHGRATLGEAAKTKLYELQHLSIGRPAQEIEGEDLDGRPLKLSAYRGQVVVIDFWANWCGWCRQMYPHERRLVARLKDQPFALLGVNCDEDKADVRQVVQRQKLSWPSWWDGGRAGGRIAQQWQIESYPRIFVLDHHGVIRYKDVREDDLDAAVDQLLQERAAEVRQERK
jgi:thiol-disulfide isomerase/thioredoxin